VSTAELAISVERLTKQFRIARQPSHTLKEAFVRLARRGHDYDNFTALDDVSLQIRQGEAVGVIGANGSGKSTLFKLVSGILRPTAGVVTVAGSISPLIELSAGFHPELTGIENIYLNAAIYGIGKAALGQRLDDIRSFADIGEFVFSPVRVYSSGMLARLAFAVAVNVGAEILLIDEVLSVGDESFQRRCLERIKALKQSGVTVVYVSHNLKSVAEICDRVVMLERGRLLADGPPEPVIDRYLASVPGGKA
jgi:lipopolysaccharide transport system ATP-binding protein